MSQMERDHSAGAAPSRRQERRAATLNEIKEQAWRQIDEKGPQSLSLREISRSMRMSSAALYRYYPSRDELLKELSYDAFVSQAQALRESLVRLPGGSLREQIAALGITYRRWAIENPVRFGLIYGPAVPGFQQDWAELVPAAQRGLTMLLELLQAGLDQGLLRLPAHMPELPAGLQASLAALVQSRGYPFGPQTLYLGLVIWARIHGLVSLELNGQLGFLVPDTEAFYRYELAANLSGLQA